MAASPKRRDEGVSTSPPIHTESSAPRNSQADGLPMSASIETNKTIPWKISVSVRRSLSFRLETRPMASITRHPRNRRVLRTTTAVTSPVVVFGVVGKGPVRRAATMPPHIRASSRTKRPDATLSVPGADRHAERRCIRPDTTSSSTTTSAGDADVTSRRLGCRELGRSAL